MILVTGASGVVGTPLCQQLVSQKKAFVTASRSAQGNVVWDLERAAPPEAISSLWGVETLIHCAPIWFLPPHLEFLLALGVKRLLVFSSTSVLAKTHSKDDSEKELVRQLSDAEAQLSMFCSQHELALTIFRPSLIYGYGRDQNIMQIAQFIDRFGFMLLVGNAQGKRQPVHADDLVSAALNVLDEPATYGKSYNLAGGEVLSYRKMVERIFYGLDKKIRIILMPLWMYRLGLRVLSVFTHFSFSPEMANRMSKDLSYSSEIARNDFGYKAQTFLTNPDRDLPMGNK